MSLLPEAEKKDSLSRPDTPGPFDFDRALVEAAEEIEFAWPEFLPVEGIKTGITERFILWDNCNPTGQPILVRLMRLGVWLRPRAKARS